MTFREAIRTALAESGDPDPRSVGRRVLSETKDRKQLRELQVWGAEEMACAEVRFARMNGNGDEEAEPPMAVVAAVAETAGAVVTRVGRPKWRGRERDRVLVPGKGRVFKGTCTAMDCREVAVTYMARIEKNQAAYEEWIGYAEALEATGDATLTLEELWRDQGDGLAT